VKKGEKLKVIYLFEKGKFVAIKKVRLKANKQ
jgi:hypothetical protein